MRLKKLPSWGGVPNSIPLERGESKQIKNDNSTKIYLSYFENHLSFIFWL
jgi:hypothetical protein